ncbi:MAG: O-antigen ligase family protein, partial [Planctomycetes bacterium]|nr:O-antigen ligase family protein [Planctomycetota bacterium]
MSLTALLFWLFYTSGLCAALVRPIFGVFTYIVVYHINPEAQWWGGSVGPLGSHSSLLAALATVFGILAHESKYALSGKQLTLPIRLAMLFALLAVASLAWGPAPTDRSFVQAEKFSKVIIFVLLMVTCVRTPGHFQLVVLGWLAGVVYISYEANGGVGVYSSGRLTGGLGGSDFAESSGLAVHLMATLPLIGALVFMARRWWARGVLLIIGAMTVNTIIMTRTRSAIVGGAALLFVGCLSLPRRYRLLGVVGIAVGTVLALQLADDAWWRRMQTVKEFQQDASAAARVEYWQAACAIAADYPLGIGIGKFHQVVREYVEGLAVERSAHNTFLTCLAELGAPGLLVFLAIVGLCVHRMTRIIRRMPAGLADQRVAVARRPARFHFAWHAMAIRTALAGYLACGLFTTRIWAADLWMLVGMAACLDRLARETIAAAAEQDEQ